MIMRDLWDLGLILVSHEDSSVFLPKESRLILVQFGVFYGFNGIVYHLKSSNEIFPDLQWFQFTHMRDWLGLNVLKVKKDTVSGLLRFMAGIFVPLISSSVLITDSVLCFLQGFSRSSGGFYGTNFRGFWSLIKSDPWDYNDPLLAFENRDRDYLRSQDLLGKLFSSLVFIFSGYSRRLFT